MLSICISTYNRVKDLEECLKSIYNYDWPFSFEVVIVDGGSTDGTIKFLENCRLNNLKLIKQNKLVGAAKAGVLGFPYAKYEFVFFLNDDMIIEPRVIVKCCQFIKNNDKVGIIAPKNVELRANKMFVCMHQTRYKTFSGIVYIVRRSILEKYGFFQNDKGVLALGPDGYINLVTLKEGYTVAFSKEIGIIHKRYFDRLIAKKDVVKPKDPDVLKDLAFIGKGLKKYEKLRYSISSFICYRLSSYLMNRDNINKTSFKIIDLLTRSYPNFFRKIQDWFFSFGIVYKDKSFKDKDFFMFQNLKGSL